MAAWNDAEALMRSTARIERKSDAGDWTSRGTAFFVADRKLLTCAHVVAPGEELRVVWLKGEQRQELPVSISARHPDLDAAPDGPYPLPDVAVLEVGEDVGDHPIAWLDTRAPGQDLWAHGYTDEYREGVALGHSVRFENAGEAQVDEEGGRVWRLKSDRVKPGMSGAPLLDLGTGRVVALIKRTQDPYQPIGAFAVGMAQVHATEQALVDANHDANATPERDHKMAVELWGPRVVEAAEPFWESAAARDAVAEELGLTPEDLHGDDVLDAQRIARGLFATDLRTLSDCVTRLARIVGGSSAIKVFKAVATCTSHDGEPWVETVAAAELGAQIAFLTEEANAGRLLHLRSALSDLPLYYVDRSNRKRVWKQPLEAMLYSHEEDPETGLPADVERDLRIRVVDRFAHRPPLLPLKAKELDDAAKKSWELERPKLAKLLREDGVVALMSCQRLDAAFVEALVSRYPLVFLVAMGGDVAEEVRDLPAYQALEAEIDEDSADEAINRYSLTCGELGGSGA